MTADPDAATTAAADALRVSPLLRAVQLTMNGYSLTIATVALDAARPIIAAQARADERHRIRQLAIDKRAFYGANPGPPYTRPFADLLDGDTTP